MKLPVDKLFEKVEKTDSCWLWRGGLINGKYGSFKVDGKNMLVHRFSYIHFRGPIPEGLQIDHMCETTNCVNPDHLQVVTHAENQRLRAERSVSCHRGHGWTKENTFIYASTGTRRCVKCHAENENKRYHRRRLEKQ